MNFVNTAKKIQTDVSGLLDQDDLLAAGEKYDQLDELHAALQSAAAEIKLIKMGCKTQIVSRIKALREEVEILEQPNASLEDIQRLQLGDRGLQEVAPGISMRTVTVPSEEFIPDSPLYYIRATGEYAVKIQGCVVRGVLRNIEENSTKSVKCRVADCAGCKWGHDSDAAWSVGNFMYTTRPLSHKNLHMRHIGSRDRLRTEIVNATRCEKESRGRQVAHDLLVQLCINKVDNQ